MGVRKSRHLLSTLCGLAESVPWCMLESTQPSCPGEEAKARQRQGIYTGARRTLLKDKIPDTNCASISKVGSDPVVRHHDHRRKFEDRVHGGW